MEIRDKILKNRHVRRISLNMEMTSHCLYHMDLEVDGESYMIRHIVLSHVYDVVQLV